MNPLKFATAGVPPATCDQTIACSRSKRAFCEDPEDLCLVSPPLPPAPPGNEGAIKATWVTFQVRSASYSSFSANNTPTRYEASILRPIAQSAQFSALEDIRFLSDDAREVLHQRGWDIVEHNGKSMWKIYNNKNTLRGIICKRVTWVTGISTKVGNSLAVGDGAGFLETLEEGDRIALWARAEEVCLYCYNARK